ncbi:type 1 glutamine amidotransferase [Actinomycetospora sp. CA-101289]|uniref:type 1 glutamine amidotransferase n=1 Tax=Actinomycetospora sp. CA-101289 TaxID=3239893 RepID=UPI003D99DD82
MSAGRLVGVRALVIGHDHIGGTGHVGTALTAAGWSLEKFTVVPAHRFTSPDVEAEFPSADGYDLVLTLGAPWPRSAISTWAGSEVDFLATVHERGTPILGICAGAQFLAEALGGGCTPLGVERVGWHAVRSRGGVVPSGPWFQWHADRIGVSAGAEVIADSEDGPEVFRVGNSVGVQFHPEMSAALLDRWLGATPIPDQRAAELRLAAAAHEHDALDRAEALLRGLRWI